jgi:hypothetical protein
MPSRPTVVPCSAANAVVPSAIGRVNCHEGIVRERTNTAYSDYNGLQLDLRSSQLFDQLTLHTSYTWSKATDNASEIFSTFGGATTYALSQDPLNSTPLGTDSPDWIFRIVGLLALSRPFRLSGTRKTFWVMFSAVGYCLETTSSNPVEPILRSNSSLPPSEEALARIRLSTRRYRNL